MKLLLKAAGFVLVMSSLAGIAQAGGGLPPMSAPEIDPGSMVSALTLLSGGLLVLSGRRRKA